MNKIFPSICIIYIIVYITLKAWFNPKLETFNQGEKIVRIRDVIGSNGLVEVTFRKPQLLEDEEITKYEIIIIEKGNVIGKKILTDYLSQDLVKYAINDQIIKDNTDYMLNIIANTKNNKNNVTKTIESIPYSFKTNERNKNIIQLNDEIMKDMDENRKIFLQQETAQNTQNRIITDLKKRVDALRNDIVVLKSKDKDELRNVYNTIQSGDSISQVLSMPGLVNGITNASDMITKNYNVNLNLE